MATPTTLPATFVAGTVLTAAQMNDLRGAFRVLQVVQSIKTDTFSTSSTSYQDVTGLTVAITPSATSSKILLIAQVTGAGGATQYDRGIFRFNGGNSTAYVGDAAGNRLQAWGQVGNTDTVVDYLRADVISGVYLDSPSTTSVITYGVQMRCVGGTNYVNRTHTDTDLNTNIRFASSITAMEISA